MEKIKKEDMCSAKLNKKVGDCYYNQTNGRKHQRKKGEPLCSHCYNFSKPKEKINIKLTQDEHTLITGILMMHHTGIILKVKNPLMHKMAQEFSLRDIRLRIKNDR